MTSSRPSSRPGQTGGTRLDFDTVVELLEMLDGSDLPTRVEFRDGPLRLKVERGVQGADAQAPAPAPGPSAPSAPAAAAPVQDAPATTAGSVAQAQVASPAEAGEPVTSPVAGVFYRAPSPDAAPFVEVGQRVEADDTIGIVEVMKLMNTVRAGTTGTVVAVLAENASLVEYEQVLVRIEPEA